MSKEYNCMKKIISFIIIALSLLGLSACIFNRNNPYPYLGQHIELYTAAIYSIPDAEGYMFHGEGAYNSDIYIWEQDDYGRTIFSYCEDYGNQVFGLVLCQTYDDKNVYFYPDVNYVLTLIDSEDCYEVTDGDYLKNKTESLYLNNKDKLKAENDWNEPMNKSKCVSYQITDHKVLGDNLYKLSSVECSKILNDYSKTLNLANPDAYPHRNNSILQVDANGKILHQISGVHQYHDNPDWKKTDEYTFYKITLWVITDKEGNYDKENGVMVMYSKENDSDPTFVYDAGEVLEFKNKNGWKNPE